MNNIITYTHSIATTLKDYNNILYKMIEVRIISNGKFEHRALPINVVVTDGINLVESFICIITGNQKELVAFFTVDAFGIFSGNVSIKFGYDKQYNGILKSINIQNISPLPPILSNVSYQIANNNWLQNLNI